MVSLLLSSSYVVPFRIHLHGAVLQSLVYPGPEPLAQID